MNVLFDLDGTLVDSKEGILRTLRYALETVGAASPPRGTLENFIGNPLHDTFERLLHGASHRDVARALSSYRRRYTALGLYESRVYPGVDEMLERVTNRGWRAFVVTGKPSVYARRMVRHFGLHGYVTRIYGSYVDGRLERKDELIRTMLQTERLPRPETIMVGDRRQDIEAARRNGLEGIGVTYGYGSPRELQEAKATSICASPRSVFKALVSRQSRRR